MSDYTNTIQSMYVTYFGRPADVAGLANWEAHMAGGMSEAELVAAFESSAEYGNLSAEQVAANAAAATIGADNKINAANAYTDASGAAYSGAAANAEAATWLASVDGTAASLAAAMDVLSGVVVTDDPDTTVYLKGSADVIELGGGDDTIIARGNSSLDNADIIDGGAGTDTIEVMLDNGETAESPLVTNVEILKVQAQSRTVDSGDNDVDVGAAVGTYGPADVESNIDAGDMESVQQYWSEDSRADVTIEDVSRNSHITTVGMRETDPGDVDYNVFFDPQNITKFGDSDGSGILTLDAVNVLSLAEGGSPLANFDTVTFSVANNGDGAAPTDVTVSLASITTYAGLVAAINAKAIELGLNGVTAELVSQDRAYFSIDVVAADGSAYGAQDYAGNYSPINITSTIGALAEVGTSYAKGAPSSNMVASMSNSAISGDPALTSVEVILDRVGRNSDGGDLLIGSDSTGRSGSQGIQQFNIDVDRDSSLTSISSTNNTLEVVNVENISVNSDGAGDLNVGMNAVGSMWVPLGMGLPDIRVFDSTAMVGDARVGITVSDAATMKYMNLRDDATDSSADNSELRYRDVTDTEFSYDFGPGNDALNLMLGDGNLDMTGTTNREDFVMVVNGGAGNDMLTTMVYDDVTGALSAATINTNWYINSALNANMTVNGGTGDDTISTVGGGNMVINGDSGNDVIYANNDGNIAAGTNSATWIVNAANTDLLDIQSNGVAGSSLLYMAQLTVTISGGNTNAGATAGVIDGAAVQNLNGYESTVTIGTNGYVGTSANVNQAIKAAINDDAVLSALLTVTDGPANTLVIRSDVDGTFDANDIDFNIAATNYAALTASNQTGLDTAWEKLNINSAVANVGQADLTAAAAAAHALIDTEVVATDPTGLIMVAGSQSVSVSDNMINMGTGNDIAVLGTDANSNDTLVFTGSAIGDNTVVNFVNVAGDAAQDSMNFNFYLNNTFTAAGSVSSESTSRVATTGDNAGVNATTLAPNEVATVNNWTPAVGQSWAGMTGAHVLSAIQNTAGTSNYGNLTNISFDIAVVPNLSTGQSQKGIIMIENNANQGEYHVYETTASNATGEFTAVHDLGDVDFGNSVDASVAGAVASNAGMMLGVAAGGGVVVGPVVPPAAGVIDLVEGTSAPVAATVDADIFSFNVAAAQALTANTQIEITAFDVTADKLSIDSATAAGAITLDALNGVDGITVQSNVITGSTLINFGPDSDGDVVTISLAGVTDASLVMVEVA